MKPRTLCAALGALLLSAQAGSANVGFECGVANGVSYDLRLLEAENVMELTASNAANGAMINRFYLSPAGGARYANRGAGFTFEDQNATGVLTSTSGLRFNCVVSDITGSPALTTPASNFVGFSFGGNLRAGPGTQFADVGSTFNGQPLTLVSDSFVSLNGFTWWRVRLQNGQEAFQWGGLLCSPGNNLGGVFNDGC